MKKLFSIAGMLLMSGYVFSQAMPVSTMIEKENRNAVMIVINQPVKVTTEALQQKLQRAGLDEKVRKGLASYKGVTLSEISKDKIDIYTKVESSSNNTSIVYMAVSKGYNNFATSTFNSYLSNKISIRKFQICFRNLS